MIKQPGEKRAGGDAWKYGLPRQAHLLGCLYVVPYLVNSPHLLKTGEDNADFENTVSPVP